MILRQTLNFAAHLGAGVAFGALAYIALSAMKGSCRDGATRGGNDRDAERPDEQELAKSS